MTGNVGNRVMLQTGSSQNCCTNHHYHNISNTTVADFFQLAYSKLNSTTRTRPDPRGLCRRPARTQRSFAAKKIRAGPCGSGRVRVGSV